MTDSLLALIELTTCFFRLRIRMFYQGGCFNTRLAVHCQCILDCVLWRRAEENYSVLFLKLFTFFSVVLYPKMINGIV